MNSSTDRREMLHGEIFKSSKFADWIFHDVRLDCDNMANERTAQRLRLIDEQFGKIVLFGMAAWWAVTSFWKLEDAHEIARIGHSPDLLPKDVDAILANESEPEHKRRAFVSAQQFISTVANDDVEMAEAIFSAAYDSGVDDYTALMYTILILSIRINDAAERIARQ